MSAVAATFAALAGTVIGATLTFLAGFFTQEREHAHATAERLHTERREVYVALLASSNECAHQLGLLADQSIGREQREAAAHLFDSDVTARYRAVQLVGSVGAVRAAKVMREKLETFRNSMSREGPSPSYRSPDYDAVYQPFRKARKGFVDAARRDLTE